MKYLQMPVLLFAITTVLAGCGSDNDDNKNVTGSLDLGITDAPVHDAEKVMITFSGIEINPANGNPVTVNFNNPKHINLLALQGVNSESLLSKRPLVPGDYNWIRLIVDEGESYIQINGVQHALTIPSGSQTGLKLNRNFTVGVGSTTSFTIDFDLHKSIHKAGNNYMLRPTLRIMDNLEVSAIRGTVDSALILDTACINNGSNHDKGNLVYLFSGSAVTPEDISGSPNDAIITATVVYNPDTEQYEYEIGFVPEGDYTLAFSCDGRIDDADTDDNVNFSAPINVSVIAEQDSNGVNFP